MKKILYPFYRWGNWDSQLVSNLLLAICRRGTQRPVEVALRNDSQHLFPLTPNPFLNCTLPFLNYRRFHHVHTQGCVGGWRGCHYTGKMLSIWKNFAFIWGLLFVSLSSPKCPCVQALPLLNSYYYLALEGHANCLITWRVMKQLGHQHIIQVWVPKGK